MNTVSKTNHWRASCAAKTLIHFEQYMDSAPSDPSWEPPTPAMICKSQYYDPLTLISELFADLRHLCDVLKISYEEADERGQRYYTRERNGCDDFLDEDSK